MPHQFDPDMLGDEHFEPGALQHIVVGNRGRLLDPRRTPIRIVDVDFDSGQFVLEIEAFEDKGARWEVPFELVDRYQFFLESAKASGADVARHADVAARFDRPMSISCDPHVREETLRDLRSRCADVRAWLDAHASFFRNGRTLDLARKAGPPELCEDLRDFMANRSVWDIEDAFTTQYVSNPGSGELVKGHRIVLAEAGLVPYQGKIVRSQRLFEGGWSQRRRREHILWRLAFVRQVFEKSGHQAVVLYRGLCSPGPPTPPRNDTFVSASFDFEVARSCFGERASAEIGVLYRQPVPVERLFMTYLETAAMNRQFEEAEAVLLWEEGNAVF